MSVFEASMIDDKVQEAIFQKINALNRVSLSGDDKGKNFFEPDGKTSTALEPQKLNPIGQQLVRSVFVRVQADVPKSGIKDADVKSGDLQCEQLAGYMTGDIRNNTVSQKLEPISFNKNPFNGDRNYIWRGESGITGLTITQQSFFIKKIEVSWECPNPVEFETRFLPKFLRHGRFMVVEFGWGIDQDEIESKIKDGEDKTTIALLTEKTKERNTNYAGSYQMESGVVTNYNYEMTNEGGYKGTIEIISRGSNVLKSPISNPSGNVAPKLNSNTKFKNKGNKQEDRKRFIRAEATFKEVITNLDEVLSDYLFVKDYAKTVFVDLDKTVIDLTYNFKNGVMRYGKTGGTYKFPREGEYGYLVSWGWFEDNILNSFFRVNAESENGKQLTLQEFRSVHTQTDEEYEVWKTATSADAVENKLPEKITIDNRCNYNENLRSLGFNSIILPGGNTFPELDNSRVLTRLNRLREIYDDKIEVATERDQKDNLKLFRDEIKEAYYLYDVVQKAVKAVNENFKPFYSENEEYGYIRNIVFDSQYIQKAFNGATTVQQGIQNLWEMVQGDYGNFWNFQLHTDFENNGRVGVIDYNYMNKIEKDIDVTNPEKTLTYDDYLSDLKKQVPKGKMFQFGLNSQNSIVKSFNLDLKLSSEAASLTLYGSNKDLKNGSLTSASSTKDLSIERHIQLLTGQSKLQKKIVGNKKDGGSDNDKENESIVIKNLTIPIDKNDFKGLTSKFYEIEQKVSELEDAQLDFGAVQSIKSTVNDILDEINPEIPTDFEGVNEEDKNTVKSINENSIYNLKGDLKPIEVKDSLDKSVNSQFKGHKSNWQLLNVVIPIDLTLTIDGVGGLQPGNCFVVDNLPKLYRRYAYFQIFSINHTINSSGWDTSITARMKLNSYQMAKDGLMVLDVDDNDNQEILETPLPELNYRTSEFDIGAFAPDPASLLGTEAGRSAQEIQAQNLTDGSGESVQAGGGNVYRQTPVVGQGPQG